MELTHLVLHPGEAIRTPRILIMQWQGDRTDAHNRFRRLLLAHYVPRVNGQLPPFALGAQSFNMNAGGRAPQWNTEAGQLRAARINRDIGGETLWMDAGWFDGGFPNGVGNWTVRATEYPNGLGPVGKACADLGLNYLIWWEPERVAPGTRITREHPEFVLGGAKGGLFNLADPKARAWMTDLLLRQIDEFGVRVYRNDFNMDPLPYWRAADAPDRQGITEIRYVEGLYAMWDEIRAKTPGTVPDDCASGGRRIDLEMCMRSIVQTRSDTAGAPGRAEWDQCQTLGLSLFLPLHATFNWETDTYSVRSAATCGYLGEWDILDPAFPVKQATACFAEIKENRKFWYGDFYPLTGWSMAADPWMAWQFDRPDLGEGIVQAFRRAQSPYVAFQARLRGLDAARSYEVALIDDEHRSAVRTMKGADLAVLELRLEKPRSSVVVRYKAK
jgi:alpha-galactosidase